MKLKIIIMVVFVCLMAISCSSKGSSLNGEWVNVESERYSFSFKNGQYEETTGWTPRQRMGKYETKGGKITLTKTHIHGGDIGLEPKWYSEKDFKTGVKNKLVITDHFGQKIELNNEIVNALFQKEIYDYVASVNTITFSLIDQQGSVTFRKKN